MPCRVISGVPSSNFLFMLNLLRVPGAYYLVEIHGPSSIFGALMAVMNAWRVERLGADARTEFIWLIELS